MLAARPHAPTTDEIDDAWLLEERKPSSAIEGAFWSQFEGKALLQPFETPSPAFKTDRPLRRRKTY